MEHLEDNIGFTITYLCLGLAIVVQAVKLLFPVIDWYRRGIERERGRHNVNKQIIEDAWWDRWIEDEAKYAAEYFEGKGNVSFFIKPPKSYCVYHPSAKYKDRQITEYVFRRFQALREGEGRRLILN